MNRMLGHTQLAVILVGNSLVVHANAGTVLPDGASLAGDHEPVRVRVVTAGAPGDITVTIVVTGRTGLASQVNIRSGGNSGGHRRGDGEKGRGKVK